MYRSQVRLSYEALGKIFDLPPDAFVTGVIEEGYHGTVQIRIMSQRPAPEEFSIDDPSKPGTVGEAYRNPENYPAKKGCCRGDSLCSE